MKRFLGTWINNKLYESKADLFSFPGQNDRWVERQSFRSFCRALVALERHRTGEAVLESISPGELNLCVYSTNSSGHMAIEGTTGHDYQGDRGAE